MAYARAIPIAGKAYLRLPCLQMHFASLPAEVSEHITAHLQGVLGMGIVAVEDILVAHLHINNLRFVVLTYEVL